MKYSRILFLGLALVFSKSYAQTFPEKTYPANYFRNPVNIPIQLSGNFGELRSNHYHMGLDIRTAQRENLPVYAAAEGFISRVKIERYGYGRAIYIDHPNGYTTLYAHLNDFYKELNDYIKSVQYDAEQWEQYIQLPPGKFPVSKGDFIAYSGNTGGSQGPHLHFEIRDTKTDRNINPLHFNLNIPDHVRPQIYGLYYYDRRTGTYQGSPIRIPLKANGGTYTSPVTVSLNSPVVSFGIAAEDKTDQSFKFGIYEAELWQNDSLKNAFRMDDFSYDDSRYINAGIDYKTKYSGGTYIQHLSRLPGNLAPIFTGGNGVLQLGDTGVHNIRIVVRDVNQNTTTITFKVRYEPSRDNGPVVTSSTQVMLPGLTNQLVEEGLKVDFSTAAFYDTVPFKYVAETSPSRNAVSKLHSLHNVTVPVQDSFAVIIKPNITLDPGKQDRVIMQLTNPRKKVAMKGSWKGDRLTAKFWDLGKVQLLLDTMPPVIRPVAWKDASNLAKAASISFIAEDESGELSNFRAELDDKWLMFSRKSDYFIHRFDERTIAGPHTLKVWVTDEAGNTTEKTYSFTR